jgi:hypothetical protein
MQLWLSLPGKLGKTSPTKKKKRKSTKKEAWSPPSACSVFPARPGVPLKPAHARRSAVRQIPDQEKKRMEEKDINP